MVTTASKILSVIGFTTGARIKTADPVGIVVLRALTAPPLAGGQCTAIKTRYRFAEWVKYGNPSGCFNR